MTQESKQPSRASDAMCRRLPGYYRELRDLEREGKTNISSKELARRMSYTDSQIRHDLSSFGGFGRRGIGYNVADLRRIIGSILDIERPHSMIIVGAGNIGRALALYPGFRETGFMVEAIFDVSPIIVGRRIGDLTVLPVSDLRDYIQENPVDIAVIATPASQAQHTLDLLLQSGVRGVWNFAGRVLVRQKGIIAHDVHLSDSLMSLSFRMHEKRVLSGEKLWTDKLTPADED